MRNIEEKSSAWRRMRGILIFMMAVLMGTALLSVSGGDVMAAKKVKSIKWSNGKKTLTMKTSASKTLKVVIAPKSAAGKKLVWKSSKKSIATVSSKGKIKAKKPGVATITCYVKGQKKKKVTCQVRVKPVLVTSVKVSAKDPVMQVGETYKGGTNVKVLPQNAYNRKVQFTSSNTSVAKVNKTTGVVTGKRIGKATITCKAKDGSKKKVTYKVTVVGKITAGSTKFVAHRGFSAAAPENTQRAYILAGQNGFWGCEGDIWKTKDGHFIMNHNASLEAVCGVNKKPSQMTLAEIRQMSIITGNNYEKYRNDPLATTIPTFEEYLTICKEYDMVPLVDIKLTYSPNAEGTTNQQDAAKRDMKAMYDIAAEILGDREIKFVAFDLETLTQMREVEQEAQKAADTERERLAKLEAEKKKEKEQEEKAKEEGKESEADANENSQSTNEDDLKPQVPVILPKLTLQHVVKEPNTYMINYYKNRGIELSACGKNLSESELLKFQEKGVVVDVWTIDDEEDTWTWITREVEFITTGKAFWL